MQCIAEYSTSELQLPPARILIFVFRNTSVNTVEFRLQFNGLTEESFRYECAAKFSYGRICHIH